MCQCKLFAMCTNIMLFCVDIQGLPPYSCELQLQPVFDRNIKNAGTTVCCFPISVDSGGDQRQSGLLSVGPETTCDFRATQKCSNTRFSDSVHTATGRFRSGISVFIVPFFIFIIVAGHILSRIYRCTKPANLLIDSAPTGHFTMHIQIFQLHKYRDQLHVKICPALLLLLLLFCGVY